MILKNINHDCAYHTQKTASMFFPLEKIRDGGSDDDIIVITSKQNNTVTVSAKVYSDSLEKSRDITDKNTARSLSLLMFDVLSEITGFVIPWGILYGVRPARLMHSLAESVGEKAAYEKFLSDRVLEEKAELALEVMKNENKIIALSGEKSFSLYISIPFCPTRCSYCSFVSHSIEKAGELTEPYVELLCREIRATGEIARSFSLNLETVYFGGGTPTALSGAQLDKILCCVEKSFDLSHIREYTVEAGRPDTVSDEKLRTLRSHGVGRISINPQTFSDEVRRKAGRFHTTEQTLSAYDAARRFGFENINMDFIAGLEGDTFETFSRSIDAAAALCPESITVHNLALKSASYLVTENEFFDDSRRNSVYNMIEYSQQKLRSSNYIPYYMYRQSKSLGNLENVGWCKYGCEGLYNIFMMDETHTVLSAGAGAVTKLKNPLSGHIDRIYNFKYPYEYVNNFSEILDRKRKIIEFLKK